MYIQYINTHNIHKCMHIYVYVHVQFIRYTRSTRNIISLINHESIGGRWFALWWNPSLGAINRQEDDETKFYKRGYESGWNIAQCISKWISAPDPSCNLNFSYHREFPSHVSRPREHPAWRSKYVLPQDVRWWPFPLPTPRCANVMAVIMTRR